MSVHILPLRSYFAVFGSLIVFTVLTVYVAFVDLGPFADVVAVAIAVTKATLVILIFMHVKYSGKLVKLFAASGAIWLIILFAFLVGDFWARAAW